MATPMDEHRTVAVFKNLPQIDNAASNQAGRPIYKDREVCEIRTAANKQTVLVVPAHQVWRHVVNEYGNAEPQTYAMRFPEQYKRFKANEAQVQDGTPLAEAPFLTQAKRLELKALNVHTVETLASLDGHELKNLGQGGREMKNQAMAYLENATSSATATKLASENEQLRQRIAELQDQAKLVPVQPSPNKDPHPTDDMADDDIKAWLGDATSSRPRGNPSRETLVRMFDEANAQLKEKAA